jgi:N-sulfoglucosamine sulfohydrolase
MFFRAATLFLAFALSAGVGWAAQKNVVLFVTDDQGQDAGCYGNPVIRTPNLDSLAEDGVRFDYAFATTASCSASRSVILTGLHNHRTAQYGHTHEYHHFRSYEDLKTLPVLLEESGYRTASVGKFHVAPRIVYRFQEFLNGSSRNPVEMANNSREFIQRDKDHPFFLYFCTSDPHRGGGQAEELPNRPDRFGNLPQGYEGIETTLFDPDDVIVPPFLPDTPAARAELAQYYQSVSRVDQGLGRLIEVLKEAGAWEDTLFIYISDHGIAFPGAKTTVYEPGLRSPCIVRNPYSVDRGVATRAMVSWVDLTPTILDFTGVTTRQLEFHGRSFLPVLDDVDQEGWDEVFASHTFHEVTMYYPMRVARERRYKLIWNIAHQLPYPFATDLWAAPTWQEQFRHGPQTSYGKRTVDQYIHRPEFELYNLQSDPVESRNLAADPQHMKLLERLKTKIRNFQERTEDPWIMKWSHQ